MPTEGAIMLVLDPEDSATCAAVVRRLACVAHGRVVCYPTPAGSPTWLGCDVLLALGKRFEAIRAEHVGARAWELAAVWLRAEAIEHLIVGRAHALRVDALRRLGTLQQRTGVHLWLVSARANATAAQAEAFGAATPQTLGVAECVRRWRQAARACGASHRRAPAEAYPRVPSAEFPVFRALCRRLLDPSSFAVVDRTFAAALADTLSWLGARRGLREQLRLLELALDELDAKIPCTARDRDRRVRLRHELDAEWYGFERDARNQLEALTSTSRSPSETLVRLRAAQAGYFRLGLLLQVAVPSQAFRGAAEFGAAFDADLADQLRGLCRPDLAAAAALALALRLGPHALASLRVGELTASGAALELRHGERRVLPAATAALVRAQLVQRWDQGAGDDDALFCRPDGAPAGEAALRRLLRQVSRRLAIAIPSANSLIAASLSWPVGNWLTLSRLPVFPLLAR